MLGRFWRLSAATMLAMLPALWQPCRAEAAGGLGVGAAAVDIRAADGMLVAGGIHPGRQTGQEGSLRAAALVVQTDAAGQSTSGRLCIVSCDVLAMTREDLDQAGRRIESELSIPFENILITSTHTHHAPSTVTVHAYGPDETFRGRVLEAIVDAARAACQRAKSSGPCELYFWLGEESSVGQNSRLLLSDGTIFWVGSREDAVRPTGPFDPELPVLAFKAQDGTLKAVVFNHSTHNIGTIAPGQRSPGFYGLGAQQIEKARGTTVLFLPGAFGSTHNLSLGGEEMTFRIRQAIEESLELAEPRPVDRIGSKKWEFTYRVRHFDEAGEEEAVAAYCRKRMGSPESVIEVFRDMRRQLAPRQGQARKTWLQVCCLGDIALVGVPGELFTKVGQLIKRRSPFRYTYVVGLANDYIGYIPDAEAYQLGGYQVWTGLHSYVEKGTAERLADETVAMLRQCVGRN